MLKVISRSARYAETALKYISILTPRGNDIGNYVISHDEMSALFTILATQQNFLQQEYAALIVKNTFNDETSRLFRAFESHNSAFSSTSLNNLRIAADLAVARDRVFR